MLEKVGKLREFEDNFYFVIFVTKVLVFYGGYTIFAVSNKIIQNGT
jgi:hypothetical protein